MKLSYEVGGESRAISLPEGITCEISEPPEFPPLDPREAIREAVGNPVEGPPLVEWLADAERVAVIVPDHWRPVPIEAFLDVVAPILERVPRTVVTIATGAHSSPSKQQLISMLGGHVKRLDVHIHDARDSSAHVHVGTTTRGTPVSIDRTVLAADRVVVFGVALPHYFAGYGGVKCIVPGVAGFDTIEHNHAHASSPDARSLRYEGNPVAEDLAEARTLALADGPDAFAVFIVPDSRGAVTSVLAGPIEATFERCKPLVDERFRVGIEKPGDVVVAGVPPPWSASLYQSQSAIEHARFVRAPGGTIVLDAPCDQDADAAFIVEICRYSSPREVLHSVMSEHFGSHKAILWAQTVLEGPLALASNLPYELVRSLFARPFPSVQAAVDDTLANRENAHVVVLPNAMKSVPCIVGSD
jgi:nickel-dependent lactate racemase